jgi:hypothetical protein
MRDGLDGDDIYIMVEDEFYAIAKTFTQHLHHAEYLRLKNLAKNRTASTASSISRPVDSITVMRNETKKKFQAETRDAQTKSALQQIKGSARPTSDDSGISDTDNGHWRGTALQGLMTVSPAKNQTSLAGLQGVKSSTRAAAGYSKAENKASHNRAKAIDLRPRGSNPNPSTHSRKEASSSDESTTDDLDAPTARHHPPRTLVPPQTAAPRSLHTSQPTKLSLKPHLQIPPSSRSKHREMRRSYPTPDSHSDSDSAASSTDTLGPALAKSQAARRRLDARLARRETEDIKRAGAGAGGGGVVTNVNEIPVFLV